MKVGILFEEIKPDAGGGFTFQYEIIKALEDISRESRHSFVIFSRDCSKIPLNIDSKKITAASFKPNIFSRILFRFSKTNIGQDIQYLLRYRFLNSFEKTLQQHKIDFMWFPTPYYPFFLDIPCIATVWDLQHRLQPYFPEVAGKGEWINRERYYKTVLQRASFIIIGNERGKEELMRFYQIDSERIKILPHPSPCFSLNTQDSSSKKILEKLDIFSGYLFYPAQFWPHKNHYIILKALCYLRNEYKMKIPLLLAGSDKGNLSYIKQLVSEYGLKDHVHFLGFIPREDLPALYQNALALIFPSYFGPENLPPLEAFALGCPVIASRVLGADEQLGDAALLFDPKDHIQLASYVKNLIENKDLRLKLIASGKMRADRWNSRNFVRGIFSILDDFEITGCSWNNSKCYVKK